MKNENKQEAKLKKQAERKAVYALRKGTTNRAIKKLIAAENDPNNINYKPKVSHSVDDATGEQFVRYN